MGIVKSLKPVGRKMGAGRAYLKMTQMRRLGLRRILAIAVAKRKYLVQISRAKPIFSGLGDIEVHILLDHKRIYEGMWSLYSFLHFASHPCSVVFHDDGTLTIADRRMLNNIFPQCRIIDRVEADATVMEYFRIHDLKRCAQLRKTLVFGLKLFDIQLFSEKRFILLDSDTLFFRHPDDLVKGAVHGKAARYTVDNGYRYCLSKDELAEFLGQDCIPHFNPGALSAGCEALEFKRMESYLEHPNFWKEDGSADYYAELTLWAMELTKYGASPLPDTYSICPDDVKDPGLVFGHYCGGVDASYVYYTRAIPYMAQILLKR